MKYAELTLEDLKRMQEVDVQTVNIEDLTDIRDIQIDTKLPVEEKLRQFAEQTNNLYVHRFGDYIVKVKFQEEGPSIDDKMEVCLLN